MTNDTNFDLDGEQVLLFFIGFVILFFLFFFLPFCVGRLLIYVFEIQLSHTMIASWIVGSLTLWLISCVNSLCKRK